MEDLLWREEDVCFSLFLSLMLSLSRSCSLDPSLSLWCFLCLMWRFQALVVSVNPELSMLFPVKIDDTANRKLRLKEKNKEVKKLQRGGLLNLLFFCVCLCFTFKGT